jgi:hypothetical protein
MQAAQRHTPVDNCYRLPTFPSELSPTKGNGSCDKTEMVPLQSA